MLSILDNIVYGVINLPFQRNLDTTEPGLHVALKRVEST